jgi:MFS family permease
MNDRAPGWRELLSGGNGLRAVVLAGGVVLHAINVYIVTTVLPSAVREIGGLGYYAWSTSLFVVASILASAVSARMLQAVGPRMAYMTGGTLFGVGTLVCSLAPSMPVLLAGRLIQGLGGGFMFALAYATIRLIFPPALWPRAIALVSSMWGVATLLGPTIGGIFAELHIWRAAFWSVLPAVAIFVLLAAILMPKHARSGGSGQGLPAAQLVLLAAAVLSVSAGSVSHVPLYNGVSVFLGIAFTAALLVAEKRARHRILPKTALSTHGLLPALIATASLLAMTVTCSEVFVPYFFQTLQGQRPLVAGYLAALMSAGWTTGSMASSGWSATSARRAIRTAPFLLLFGQIAAAALLPIQLDWHWLVVAPVCVALLAIGLGIGITWPHILSGILRNTPAEEQGLAAASITTVQLFATAFGAALAGLIVNLAGLADPGGVDGATSAARWLFGCLTVAPLIAVATTRRITRSASPRQAQGDRTASNPA